MNTRRMSGAAAAVILLTVGLGVGAARADVDLTVTGVQVSLMGNDLQMTAEVAVVDQGWTEPIATDLRFYLGARLVATTAFTVVTEAPTTCYLFSPPNCGWGYCEPKTINGMPTASGCVEVHFQAPSCGCIYLYMNQPQSAPYQGETSCAVVIDQGDAVAEADEGNNIFTASLAPVSGQTSSWSALKASFR